MEILKKILLIIFGIIFLIIIVIIIKNNLIVSLGVLLIITAIIAKGWGKWIVQVPQNEVWVTEIFKSYFRQLKSHKYPQPLIPFLEKIPESGKVNLKREVHDFQAQKLVSSDGFEVLIDYSVEIYINNKSSAIMGSVYDYKPNELIEKIHVESDSAIRAWAANKAIDAIIKAKTKESLEILNDLIEVRFKDEKIFTFAHFAIKNVGVEGDLVEGLKEIKKKSWDVKKSKLEIQRQKNIGDASRQRINAIAEAQGVSKEEAKEIYLKEIQVGSLEKSPAKVIIAKSGSEATQFIEALETSS